MRQTDSIFHMLALHGQNALLVHMSRVVVPDLQYSNVYRSRLIKPVQYIQGSRKTVPEEGEK